MEQHTPKPNGMAAAAMILGIIAIPVTCCMGFGLPLAAIGVILALLSKRGQEMAPQAKIGFGLNLGCIILTVIIMTVFTLFAVSTDSFKVMWNALYDMNLEEYNDIQEIQEYLYDVLEDYDNSNNDVSQNSDTPLLFDSSLDVL